jgi:hypothetical protein
MALLAEMFDQHMRAIGVITVRWSSIDGLIYDTLRKRLLLPARAEELRSCNAGAGRLDFFGRGSKKAAYGRKRKVPSMRRLVSCYNYGKTGIRSFMGNMASWPERTAAFLSAGAILKWGRGNSFPKVGRSPRKSR